jgi:hypothetical protein
MNQFKKDLAKPFHINGTVSNLGFYNLAISVRDLKLWAVGMKPNRGWKVSTVKTYFGLHGHNRANLVVQITDIMNRYKAGEYDEFITKTES